MSAENATEEEEEEEDDDDDDDGDDDDEEEMVSAEKVTEEEEEDGGEARGMPHYKTVKNNNVRPRTCLPYITCKCMASNIIK